MDYQQYINLNGVYIEERDVFALTSLRGDEYYTLREHAENIADNLNIPSGECIWCPFDKDDSQFVIVLRERGFKVVATHKDLGQDFFVTEPPENCYGIVSNPPFSLKKDVLVRCQQLNMKFALILPLLFINDGVPFDYGNQLMFWRKRVHFMQPDGEKNRPRTNCIALSNGLFNRDLLIIKDDIPAEQISFDELG